MRTLQGSVVPRFLGLWRGTWDLEPHGCKGTGVMWLTILEDCGHEPESFNDADRESVLEMCHHLHSCGVIHRDPQRRHILRHNDGRLRLIDFEVAGTEGTPEEYDKEIFKVLKRIE